MLRLARSGGCSIRAGGVGQKAYRLKIQDSKTQKLMTQLSTDCAMTSHPLLTALLLIRFYLETVDLSVVQSRGCPQWCAENSNADLHTCTSSCPGGCPLAARSKFAQRAALCTHSLSHKPCGRICRKRATPTLRSEDVKNSTAENHLKDRPTTFSRTLSILTLFPYPDWWRGGLHYPMCVKMSERKSSNH